MPTFLAAFLICDQVKSILKRMLAGNRPEIPAVARELGLSERTQIELHLSRVDFRKIKNIVDYRK
jgi:hypothetical protein